jgi:hypothetical protein
MSLKTMPLKTMSLKSVFPKHLGQEMQRQKKLLALRAQSFF